MSQFAAHPRAWIIAAFAVAGIGASTAFTVSSPSLEPVAEAGSDTLDKQRVIAFAGGPPERCVYAGPNRELCTWKLDGTPLAPPADAATHGANLLCELAIRPDGFEGSCSAHGRSAIADLPAVSAGETPETRPQTAPPGRAVPELDHARLLLDLSRRVGDAPDVCRTGIQQQTCIWRVSAETAARTFAESSAGRPLELRCTLPLDGSGRAPGSCSISPLS